MQQKAKSYQMNLSLDTSSNEEEFPKRGWFIIIFFQFKIFVLKFEFYLKLKSIHMQKKIKLVELRLQTAH